VTGVGLVTALGVGVEATWNGLVQGLRGIGTATLFDTKLQRSGRVAEVGAVALPETPPDLRGQWSRTSVLALTAAR
jgi:3-oxoacyl-(acyl-carrier-protein) synthase